MVCNRIQEEDTIAGGIHIKDKLGRIQGKIQSVLYPCITQGGYNRMPPV